MRRSLWFAAAVAAVFAMACGGRHEEPAAASKTENRPAATQQAGGTAEAPPAKGEVAIGAMMPAYTAQTLDGKPFDLAGERGEVVLLNLWATWCGPCRFEIPELQRLHNEYSSRGFKVIGVSLDDTGVDDVKKFVTEHKMTYPIVLDAEGKLANIFQTSSIPATVLIGRDGKIVWKEIGMIDNASAELKAALEGALNQKRS